MELWDILDQSGHKTGKVAARGKTILAQGQYHLVVHIWVVNSKGEMLIQKRAVTKELMPGRWAATGGSALSGEGSSAAARRELKEELGLDTAPGELRFVRRMTRRNSLVDIWCLKRDVDDADVVLQPEEVEAVQCVSMSRLREMTRTGRFHNYGSEYFRVIHSMCRVCRE